ncbi:HD domain-containing phosphohydrolase [Ancylobacter pratisalsi]|uniref:GAF domain-containing protein n=1 Tax=Ancylobacter pratisalsi TaxID=1745854 RepID=A0A6P1YK08_9HYPH|nr:HD domain-containing phosphohydrolase [Ancylobacter pratisalsi]QIB33629.1 GAF domain-containing protein [Ancylobacter pratisalsi]
MAKRRLDTHLALVFGVTVMIALAGIVFFVNNRAAAILEGATSTLFDRMAGESRSHIDKSFNSLDMLTQLFATDPEVGVPGVEDRGPLIERFRIVMDRMSYTSAIYVGYDNGDFLLLRHLTSDVARRNLGAGEDAAYMLQSIRNEPDGVRVKFLFLDGALRNVGTLDWPDFSFDPRQRGWYRAAMEEGGTILTAPYRFFATSETGVTIAHRLASQRGVVGIDLSLADLSRELKRMKSTPSSEILIADHEGRVIASSSPAAAEPSADRSSARAFRGSSEAVPAVVPFMLAAVRAHPDGPQATTFSEQGRRWMVHMAPLSSGPWTFSMAVAMPHDEVMASVRSLVATLGWISLVLFLFVVVAIRLTARAVSRPLVAIAREAEAIQSFNFKDVSDDTYSSVAEIDILSRAIRNARLTIQRFIEIGRALSVERDPDRLVRRLLEETIKLTHSEAGVILLSEDGGKTFTGVIRRPGESSETFSTIGPLNAQSDGFGGRLVNALTLRTVVHLEAKDGSTDPVLAKLTEGIALGEGEVFRGSVIPLLDRGDETIGGLALLHRTASEAEISDASLDLARALSGNAAVAIETTLALKSNKALLDAVIRMIAQAIDAKSPYTNGHCQRVPVLTHALARAACDRQEGPFADFNLSPDDWEAVDVASWLHDCGKLTTAEYVIDKATKLETITNRIHEIRMRFELLKSEAATAYWKGVAEGGNEAALRAQRDQTWRELDDDFAFVAECNHGGEFMEPAKVERLERIAARRWTRTLDDRLGISEAEGQRRARVPAPTLPVAEPLLSDAPHHIVPHFANQLDAMEKEHGFALKRPENRLNLGEIYNLSIARGTLTAEERYEINRHITRTIVMLEALPLSGALTRVPEYAGAHHEHMDGAGYPRGLHREEMSDVARMMAVADVFEALTAADRPYRKAKTLSEAIRIMGMMKRDNHLDPDLLDLFLTSGLWRDYAQAYMDPAQIDEPDIDAVLAIRPAPHAPPAPPATA